MENLNSFREVPVEFGKEHRWDQSTNNKFHLYLLASKRLHHPHPLSTPGCSVPGCEDGLPSGDRSTTAGAPALPAGTPVSLLTGPGIHHAHFEVMWRPGAPY